MEYQGKFGHTIGRIQHIALISRTDICYTNCRILTQTVTNNLPGFQGIKCFVQYLAIHPHKPIFFPYNSYDGSNITRLIWNGNKVEDYISKNCLEFYLDADHARTINRRCSVLGILHTMLGFSFFWRVQIQPAIAYDSTDG